MTIGCFGDKLSHTFAATAALIKSGNPDECEIRGYDSVRAALQAVKNGECSAAVVPIENSVEGTVTETADSLGELGLYVTDEIILPVRQSLITLGGVKKEDIKTVYSHPQALAQCRETLRNVLPAAKSVPVAFTSAGLNMLDSDSAAIARAPKDGQVVLLDNIADSADNCTRFIAVKSKANDVGEKISVLFSTENKPGALLDVLSVIKSHGLNMVKIESRPAKKKMGQYVFYVDFLVSGKSVKLDGILGEISLKCGDLQFLGRYNPYSWNPADNKQ